MSLPVSQGGFNSQGSLSWADFVAKPVQYSVDVLARTSAAGVDPYTLHVAHFIADRFRLGQNGARKLQTALIDLKYFSGYAKALWFGVGVQSLVRMMARTDQGRIWVALSAALSECYHEDFAAEILHQMALSLEPPGRLTPSVSEWYMIVKACQGTLSQTDFPVRAEALMSLDPSVSMGSMSSVVSSRIWVGNRGCSAAKDIAAVLMGMGRTIKEDLKSITVVGGSDAGILAALAEWLFDLKVAVTDTEGQPKYSNCHGDLPQLQIIFDRTGAEKHEGLEITSQTYFLSDVQRLFSSTSPNNSWSMVSGRLDWKSCLIDAFTCDVEDLLTTQKYTFRLAVVCAAKILDSVLKDGKNDPNSFDRSDCAHFEAAAGLRFINNLLY